MLVTALVPLVGEAGSPGGRRLVPPARPALKP
jgi:hypothetical protein